MKKLAAALIASMFAVAPSPSRFGTVDVDVSCWLGFVAGQGQAHHQAQGRQGLEGRCFEGHVIRPTAPVPR